MNHSERAMATEQILDAKEQVRTKDGTELTVQQIICGLTDHDNNKIFTGAEIMGRSDKTLLTFNANMEVIARTTATHIAEAVKRLITKDDYGAVEDDRKIASRETKERQQEEEQSYISGISSEWVYDNQREEGESVSTMSSLTGLDTLSNTLNFSTEAAKTVNPPGATSSDTTVNQWESAPIIRNEDRKENSVTFNSHKGVTIQKRQSAEPKNKILEDMQRRLQEISDKAEKEQEERKKENAAYTNTFVTISTTIEKQQKQISTQNEELRQMRTSQLEIRQAQAAQLTILQQILLALHGEGSLPDTATSVDTLITRTSDQREERPTCVSHTVTQTQTQIATSDRQGVTVVQQTQGKQQNMELKEPPSGGDR